MLLFVSCPFAVNSAPVAFEAIDPRLEQAARSQGATPRPPFRLGPTAGYFVGKARDWDG